MSTSFHPSADTSALIHRAVRWTELFADWPEASIQRVVDIARVRHYDSRTQVMAQDRERREVLIVVSGCLEVSRVSTGGTKFVLSLLGAGTVVGLVRLLHNLRLPYDYYAHNETVLVHLPSDELRKVLDAEPILWRDVALLALSRQRDSIASMQQRALGGIQQSLAETLVKLTAWYGVSSGAGKDVLLKISQNDLASMLGVSRQTMNKELREMTTRGLIAVEYGQLTVRNLEGLTQMAENTA
jgi:CRP/FNR family cyclic AMP-dependent transcriptional regulator